MNGLASRISSLLAPQAAASAPPAERPGSLIMPQQSASSQSDLPANTSYSLAFQPGFIEAPVWPVETWYLSSFQVALSGTLVVPLELELTPESETLTVTLALFQNSRPVWSRNLDLRLVPELATGKRSFKFETSVFVDLVNPLPYQAGAAPRFVISGIVPVYKPGPGTEQAMLAALDEIAEHTRP